LGERRRIETGENYGLKGEAEIEFIAKKSDLGALHGGQLRMLRRGLNDTVSPRRIVMVRIALGCVGVQRFRVCLIRRWCALDLCWSGVVVVRVVRVLVRVVAVVVIVLRFLMAMASVRRVVMSFVVVTGGLSDQFGWLTDAAPMSRRR
jgi:hypothetical protein